MSRIQLHLFPLPFPASIGVFVPVQVESGKSVHPCSWSSFSRVRFEQTGAEGSGCDTVHFGDRFSNDRIGRGILVDCNRRRGGGGVRLLPSHVDRIGKNPRGLQSSRAAVESLCRPTSIESAGESSSIATVAGAAVKYLRRPTSIESAEESSSIAIVAGAAVESDSRRPTSIESAGESSSIAIVAGAAVESDSRRPTSIESAGESSSIAIVAGRRWSQTPAVPRRSNRRESSSIAIVAGAAVESDSCRPTSIESAGESSSIAIVAGAAVESDSCRPTSAFISTRATTDEPGSGSAIAAGSSEGVSCSGLGPDSLRSAWFGTSTAVETAFGLVSSTRSGGELFASIEASAASNGA